jgi:transposase
MAALGLCAAALGGCWSKTTPQQSFAEALMRGNSMQASQIWLKMSPEDRLKFSRGEGIKPDAAYQENVKQQVINHYQQQLGQGPSTAEEMEQQIPTSLGASLENLNSSAQSGGTSFPSESRPR